MKRADKLECRAEEGILVGYCRGDAYLVLLSRNRTRIDTKHVKIIVNDNVSSSYSDLEKNEIDFDFRTKPSS